MYENVTYEDILKRMLSRVSADLDKREGSILYDALAPAAMEMQMMYTELYAVLNELFADTAGREYLVRRAAERGLTPKASTYAVLKGEFDVDIPIGSRFSLETLNYVAVERIARGQYKMQCETIGTAGNMLFGTLIPIEYIRGLTKAELTELLIPGEDEEETERFRRRYFDSLNSQAFGGNIADYREKVNGISGVGGVKVYPAWNGGGTVKLVIIGSDYGVPSDELIRAVKDTIDPEVDAGKGYGLAPIGHVVTVEGAAQEQISISATIVYQTDYNFERCKEDIFKAIDTYLHELNMTWQDDSQTIVRVSRIEGRLLDIEGIMDADDTTINGKSGNYALLSSSIAVRGDVSG